ncbi:MAG: hypothetical protein OEY52_13225 [Gammaproteobacteria bacterium]|nr:hypothetical protein [Gammaproteobacteria bacterium]
MTNYSPITLCLSLLILAGMLSACASAPEDNEQNYWHVIAQQHMNNGALHYQRHQFHQAVHQFISALKTYQRFNAVDGELNSRINLAKTCIALHQLDLAQQHIDEAQRLITSHGLSDKTVYLDIMRSSISIQKGELKQAGKLLEKYASNTSLPEDVYTALLVNNIRLTLLNRDKVSPLLQQLELVAKDKPKYEPRLWRFRAQQDHVQKQFASSDKYYFLALQRYRSLTDSMGVLMLLREWGANLIQRGEWQAARVRYQDMYNTALSLKLQHHMSVALTGLVQVLEKVGDAKKLDWARQQLKNLSR